MPKLGVVVGHDAPKDIEVGKVSLVVDVESPGQWSPSVESFSRVLKNPPSFC